jgi:HupE / UreJ protein
MPFAFLSRLSWLLIFLGVSSSTFAHPMPNSVLLLDVHEKTVRAELQIPLSELGLAIKEDLLSKSDSLLATYETRLESYLVAHIHLLTPAGELWQVTVDSLNVKEVEQTATGPYRELVAALTFTPPYGASTRQFTLDYDAVIHQVVTHIILVSIRQDWMSGVTAEHATEAGVIRINPVDGTIAPLEIDLSNGNLWRGFLSMVKLGMTHISEGTDHLLFLLTLLLPAPLLAVAGRWGRFAGTRQSLQSILKIVTAFTVGHSLTLILGTVTRAHLPSQPIEVLIAVSIFISALHALRPLFPNREMLVAGGFGLIHGLAFSFMLAELNLSTSQLILSLFGFNLGIEFMQLFIIALTMPWLILLARTSFYTPVRLVGASVAAVASLGWIAERVLAQANPVTLLVETAARQALWIIVGLACMAIIATLWQRSKPKLSSENV